MKYNPSITPNKRSSLKINFGERLNDRIGIASSDIKYNSKSLKPAQNKTKKYKIEDFSVLSLLGYGTFGSVLLVKHAKYQDQPYALKAIVKSKIDIETKQLTHIKNERDVLLKLGKENKDKFWPNLYESMQDDACFYFLLDYVPGGELFTFIKRKLVIKTEGIKFYMAEVICALEQLHKLNIIYRDIKLENILIDTDGHIKLVDFGFAKILKEGSKTYTNWGTPGYMAPEVIQKLGHTTQADIWGLGVLLWEMIGGFTPFQDSNPKKVYQNIIHWDIKWPKNIDPFAKDLVSKILVVDPEMRATLKQIKRHKFFSVLMFKHNNFILGNWLEIKQRTVNLNRFTSQI